MYCISSPFTKGNSVSYINVKRRHPLVPRDFDGSTVIISIQDNTNFRPKKFVIICFFFADQRIKKKKKRISRCMEYKSQLISVLIFPLFINHLSASPTYDCSISLPWKVHILFFPDPMLR